MAAAARQNQPMSPSIAATPDQAPSLPEQPPVPPVPRRWSRTHVPDLAAAAALIGALLLLYHQVLRLWWTHDDVFVLHYVSEHRPWQYCLEAQVWRQLPMRMLTPLLFLSMHLDLGLFGPDPRAQYAHQLAAAALAFLAFYAVLRLWLPPAAAALGTGVALAGAPAASLMQLPTTRHYLEGLLLAALSIVLFVRALRRPPAPAPSPETLAPSAPGREPAPRSGRGLALSLSALCYLAASLAKEVFVPLVLFYPWLAPRGIGGIAGLGRRLRLSAPHLGAFLFYLGWRLYMLGTLGGGYGWSVGAADLPRLAAALPLKLVRAMAGPSPRAGTLLLAALVAGAAAACYRRPRAVLLLLAAAVAATGPILPASTEMEPRWAFPLWLILAAALAFGCERLARGPRGSRAAAVLLAGLAVIAAVAANRQAWAESYAAAERTSVENRTLLALPAGDYLRHPAGPPASLHELQWLRQAYLRRPPGGGWFFDDLFLCAALPPAARVREYEPLSRRVEDITARVPRLRAAHCGSIREDAPLRVDLLLANGNLRWQLGPYTTGTWSLVVAGGQDAYSVPSAGGFQVPALSAVTLQVHYASPAGWHAYSPPLSLAAGRGAHVAFIRSTS